MSETRIEQHPRRLASFVAVAAVSLAIGAAGAWLALREAATAKAADTTPAQGTGAATGQQPASEEMPGMDMSASSGAADTKGKGVYISPARQQLIGVRTASVEHRALDTTIRTVGTLAYDETRVTQIHAKIAGWVERVFVDYVGKAVRRGEPLFTIYSPELVATQNEYLLALKAQRQFADSVFPETRAGAVSLLAATRERLRLWDITDAQVEELERTGQSRRTLTLYSPFNGTVLERNTFAGQYITPETSTFKIADLSTVWVVGQVFEYETRMVKLGQEAEIEFPYGQSARRLKGKITFIYPEIDPQTRRVRIRVEFPNPGLEFKPESYVTVLLRTSGGHQLAIPKEALIDTGAKRYALLAQPNGYFEPREVEVGDPVDDYYPVLRGLESGDKVVTSAQFLIDSETNLQAAMQAMSLSMPGMDMGETPAAPKPAEQKD
ncbi:MAG: efflux RND transporter periplasmic adaptor subunit [Vicinamibacterales bacterium]|nr:efflux RND transporter periplasmic adaptor subunit [Vicinamibacterales bacterium]